MKTPVIEQYGGLSVVRDDLFPGGTKARVVHRLFTEGYDEYVYCSPVQGFGQVALTEAGNREGKLVKIFCAARKKLHRNTQLCLDRGAAIEQVPYGYLNVVTARARAYCAANRKSLLLPFGFDCPDMGHWLAEIAHNLPVNPQEVWCVAGSGTLTRALQVAWPKAKHYAVQVGAAPCVGDAEILVAPEKFEQDAKYPPPFPSCPNYDAKAWRFIKGRKSALFWNVA